MEINISLNNEHFFTPNIWGNMKEKEGGKFKIVLRKMNPTVHIGKWGTLNPDGTIDVDPLLKVKTHIVRLVKPPTLIIKDGDKETKSPIDIDTLCSGKYSELEDLLELILIEINRLCASGVDEKK